MVHNWWNAPETSKAAQSVDPIGSHGSWMENFPWNRVAPAPQEPKTPVDLDLSACVPPPQVRDLIGDGNYGGAYEKPDDQMMLVWQAGVEETRRVIDGI